MYSDLQELVEKEHTCQNTLVIEEYYDKEPFPNPLENNYEYFA
jgi:hypothetical protein